MFSIPCKSQDLLKFKELIFKLKFKESELNYLFPNEIKNLLKCTLCHTIFNNSQNIPLIICPKLTACSNCVELKLKFEECPKCHLKHIKPENGYVPNQTILEIIRLKPVEINEKILSRNMLLDQQIKNQSNELKHEIKQIKNTNECILSNLNKFLDKIENCEQDKQSILDFLLRLRNSTSSFIEIASQVSKIVYSELEKYQYGNKDESIIEEIQSGPQFQAVDQKIDFNYLPQTLKAYKTNELFYPISRLLNFSVLIEDNIFKLSILSQNLKIKNQDILKINQFELINSSCFDQKYFIFLLKDLEDKSTSIGFYEYRNQFHKIRKISGKYKVLYANSCEIFLIKPRANEEFSFVTICDLELKKKGLFGKSTNENEKIYLKKENFSILYADKRKIYTKEKINEAILVRVYARENGNCLNKFYFDSSYLDQVLVDKEGRIVMVNKGSKKVKIFQENGLVFKEIDIHFAFDFERFVLTMENEIAFVYFSKNLVKFLKIQ